MQMQKQHLDLGRIVRKVFLSHLCILGEVVVGFCAVGTDVFSGRRRAAFATDAHGSVGGQGAVALLHPIGSEDHRHDPSKQHPHTSQTLNHRHAHTTRACQEEDMQYET